MNKLNLEKIARDYGIPIIRSKSHDFLQEITQNEKPLKILEVGTAIGFSGIAMLEASQNSSLLTIEHNHKLAKYARKNFKAHKLGARAKVIVGDCLVELAKMVASKQYDNHFDMIFLDGPKAQYDLMLDLLLTMLKPNGIFIADNVLFRGYVQGEINVPTKRYKTIIKRLNDFIENCKKHPKLIDFELKNIEDGIIFAKKVTDEK